MTGADFTLARPAFFPQGRVWCEQRVRALSRAGLTQMLALLLASHVTSVHSWVLSVKWEYQCGEEAMPSGLERGLDTGPGI